MPVWYEGFPWKWGPLCQKAGALLVFSTTHWIRQLEFSASTMGLTTRTEQVRLMVRTVPQHRQSVPLGRGCGAANKTWSLQVAQTICGWWGETPQICCNIKKFKALTVLSLLEAALEGPFQWNATFTEVLFTPEAYPSGLDPGCAGECSHSRHVILETEAAKCPVLEGCLVLKLQHHGRW